MLRKLWQAHCKHGIQSLAVHSRGIARQRGISIMVVNGSCLLYPPTALGTFRYGRPSVAGHVKRAETAVCNKNCKVGSRPGASASWVGHQGKRLELLCLGRLGGSGDEKSIVEGTILYSAVND
jgi:hypothetical protein